jgi:hypothetical protein
MLPNPIKLTGTNISNLLDYMWARMHYSSILLLIFNLPLLSIQSCGLDIEDPTLPSPPQWVQKSLPEEWPERGIDAHESGGIYLEWQPNPKDDIVTYNIYRTARFPENDSLGEYTLISQIDLESSFALTYIDYQVVIRNKYYYKLKSIDISHNLSAYSDSIYYSLLPRLDASQMSPNALTDSIRREGLLSWTYDYHIEMEDYSITIVNQEHAKVFRERFSPDQYLDWGGESWRIPTTINLIPDQIYKWRIDVSSNYIDNRESVGSESQWATFLYVE